eukprot:222850-Chlamydomonas_euryale.AAC.11
MLRSAPSADSTVERAGLLTIVLSAGPSTRADGAMSGARNGTTSDAARLLKDRYTFPARCARGRGRRTGTGYQLFCAVTWSEMPLFALGLDRQALLFALGLGPASPHFCVGTWTGKPFPSPCRMCRHLPNVTSSAPGRFLTPAPNRLCTLIFLPPTFACGS